ncbi:MAG: peptidyl-prolyl cis-trans isomerase [Steroidobacteraceae bacterium]
MASVPAHVSAELPRARWRVRGLWQRLKREPLAHFLVLGALIFIAAHLIEQAQSDARRQIVVDGTLEQRIIQLQRAQNGTAPGPEQTQRLVENYIDDEVMYREALRMGLDQDDEIVRRRLIQKMQFLQRDLTVPPSPSDAELREYFQRHLQRFTAPATVSFEQIYFSPEHAGWSAAEASARRAREQLANGSISASGAGDAFPLQLEGRDWTAADARQVFGDTPVVQALFDTHAHEWSQPFRSGYGWHLVRPLDRQARSIPQFASVRAEVLAAYVEDAAAAANQRQIATLRSRYEIVRRAESAP